MKLYMKACMNICMSIYMKIYIKLHIKYTWNVHANYPTQTHVCHHGWKKKFALDLLVSGLCGPVVAASHRLGQNPSHHHYLCPSCPSCWCVVLERLHPFQFPWCSTTLYPFSSTYLQARQDRRPCAQTVYSGILSVHTYENIHKNLHEKCMKICMKLCMTICMTMDMKIYITITWKHT